MTTLASLFNIAGPNLIIIFFVIVLFFGAKRLPGLARGIGQAIREFSKAKDEPLASSDTPPTRDPRS